MIAPVNKRLILIFSLTLLVIVNGCDNCPDRAGIDGTIDSGKFQGAFIIMENPDTSRGGQLLNVYLHKSGLNVDNPRQLVSLMENPLLWTVKVNDKFIDVLQAFPELSNTMNARLNVVIPLIIPLNAWKKEIENQVSITFTSSLGSFAGKVNPTSMECFLKRLPNE